MPRTGRPPKEGASLDTSLTVRVSTQQLALIDQLIEESEDSMSRADVMRRCLEYVAIQKGLLDPEDHREVLFSKDELIEGFATRRQNIEALLEEDRARKKES